MARNRLAGTKRGNSKSAKFYQKNKKARDKKKSYDKKYHSSKSRKKYRAELQRINRKKGNHGNLDSKDESHKSNGKTFLEDFSKNRARKAKKLTKHM